MAPTLLDAVAYELDASNLKQTGPGTECPPGLTVLFYPKEGLAIPIGDVLSVRRSPRVRRDPGVHFRLGRRWCVTRQKAVYVDCLPGALYGVLKHHHQRRLKRLDSPRAGPEPLKLTKLLPDRRPRPKQPYELAYSKNNLLRTLIIVELLCSSRRFSGVSHSLVGVP